MPPVITIATASGRTPEELYKILQSTGSMTTFTDCQLAMASAGNNISEALRLLRDSGFPRLLPVMQREHM